MTEQEQTAATAEALDAAAAEANGGGDQDEDDGILKVWELAPDRTPIQFRADGPVLYVRSVHTLSLRERAEYDRMRKRAEQIAKAVAKKTRPNKSELEEQANLDTQLATFVLADATEEQIGELEQLDKEAVVAFFTAAFGRTMRKLGEEVDRRLGISDELKAALDRLEGLEERLAAKATEDQPTPES